VVDIFEKTGLPCFMGILQPTLRTGEFPHFAIALMNFGPMLNHLTYDLFQFFMWAAFGKMANRWRKERLGLPPVRIFRRVEKLRIPVLAAFSSHIIPKPADWPDNAYVTGYWFLEDTGWQPSTKLEDFLHSGKTPLCVGFGSTVDDHAGEAMTIIRETLLQMNQRAIVVGGWSTTHLKEENNESFHWVDTVPYDWLLPQVGAMVHHGGAGTTAAALRTGIPSVVVPFFGDQPFWADRMYKLGLSPRPIPRRSLNSERLRHAIRAVIEDTTFRRRSAAIGQKIRMEDGVSSAVKIIERYV
jgi:UDP:flavonoid glycosyltransferase YjiC (YdhE family)